jgi:solute carrier family 13 (sodium-dependent dicarboxylate transporter), member 2/3/5
MAMRSWSIFGGLVLAAAVFGATWQAGLTHAQSWTAAVTTLCAVWWIAESIPLAATALVPLALFPLTGVLKEAGVAAAYCDPLVLLFMGGFMMAKGAERWGAHRRIAQAMIGLVGNTSGRRIVLAFMLATAFVSMWISNTAAALMMLPVALAVLERDTTGKLGMPLMLGIAYSASIGGIATPIGSPPNGVFQAAYKTATGVTVPFHQWMLLGGLVAILVLLAAWVVLTWRLSGVPPIETDEREDWTVAQKRTLAVLGLAAVAWVTREIPLGGWSALVDIGKEGDTTVAIVAVLALFLIPSGAEGGEGEPKGQQLLDWPTASQIPWGVLLLFGGGIAIAKAFESSGLSALIGQLVTGLSHWPTLAIIGTVCVTVTFLSEFTSNTATSNILMPVLAAAAKASGLDPAALMFPATISNSLSFMLPVGTPPNAIAFGTGRVPMREMVRKGIVLNLVGAMVTTLVCWKLLPVIFEP